MTSYLPHRRGRYARAYEWVDGTLVGMYPPETISDPTLHNQYEVGIVGEGTRLGTIVRPYGARAADRMWQAQIETRVRRFRTRREAAEWLFHWKAAPQFRSARQRVLILTFSSVEEAERWDEVGSPLTYLDAWAQVEVGVQDAGV